MIQGRALNGQPKKSKEYFQTPKSNHMIVMLDTLWKVSDMGPSFSASVNSCSTFSNPLLIACISSARVFNCICMEICYLLKFDVDGILLVIKQFSTKFEITNKEHLWCIFQADKVFIKIQYFWQLFSKNLHLVRQKNEGGKEREE